MKGSLSSCQPYCSLFPLRLSLSTPAILCLLTLHPCTFLLSGVLGLFPSSSSPGGHFRSWHLSSALPGPFLDTQFTPRLTSIPAANFKLLCPACLLHWTRSFFGEGMGSGPGRARLHLFGEGERRARAPQSLPRSPPSSNLSPTRETEGQKGSWATAFRSHPGHQGITNPQGECADQPAPDLWTGKK